MLIYSQFMSDEKKQTNTLNNGFFHQNDVTPRCGDNRDFCLRTFSTALYFTAYVFLLHFPAITIPDHSCSNRIYL